MGYHVRTITPGVLGTPSKIREEFEEFVDAVEQGNQVMALLEASDLIGAIEQWAVRSHNVSLKHLIRMKEATERAFSDGTRKPK